MRESFYDLAKTRNMIDKLATVSEHLGFAITEFRDMKMQPSLEPALRHEEILKA